MSIVFAEEEVILLHTLRLLVCVLAAIADVCIIVYLLTHWDS